MLRCDERVPEERVGMFQLKLGLEIYRNGLGYMDIRKGKINYVGSRGCSRVGVVGRMEVRSSSPSPLDDSNVGGPKGKKDLNRSQKDLVKHIRKAVQGRGGPDYNVPPSQVKDTPPPYRGVFPQIKLNPGSTPSQGLNNFLAFLRNLLTKLKIRLGRGGSYNPSDFWGEPEKSIVLTGLSSFLKGALGGQNDLLINQLKDSLGAKGLNEEIYFDVGSTSTETGEDIENTEPGVEIIFPLDNSSSNGSVESKQTSGEDSGYSTGGSWDTDETGGTSDTESLSSLESDCEKTGEGAGESIYVNVGSGSAPEHVPGNCFRCRFINQNKGKGLNPGGSPVEKLFLQLCVLYLTKEVNEGDKTRQEALTDLGEILTRKESED